MSSTSSPRRVTSWMASATSAVGLTVGCSARSSRRLPAHRVHRGIVPDVGAVAAVAPELDRVEVRAPCRPGRRRPARAWTGKASPFRRWTCSRRRGSGDRRRSPGRPPRRRPCAASPCRRSGPRRRARPRRRRRACRRGRRGMLRLVHLARGHRELAMASLGVGMPVDPDVVGRIEEGGVDRGALADHRLQELEVAAVAAADAVLAEDPDVARLCPRACRARAGSPRPRDRPSPSRSTSISPVEKPVTVRSMSTSSDASSASSSFRSSRSQPAPSAILLSAIRRPASAPPSVPAARSSAPRPPHRLCREQTTVPGDDHPFGSIRIGLVKPNA